MIEWNKRETALRNCFFGCKKMDESLISIDDYVLNAYMITVANVLPVATFALMFIMTIPISV